MLLRSFISAFCFLAPTLTLAAEKTAINPPDSSWLGLICLALFLISYAVVIFEEFVRMRKSISIVVAAGLIWILVAYLYVQQGRGDEAKALLEVNILEFSELLLFLLVAMTYISVVTQYGIFDALRISIDNRQMSMRKVFWITGLIAFFLSPIADNLTTALVMSTVVINLGKEDRRFIVLGCINVVVAANAGGAFSPFGDITTLLIWDAGHVGFLDLLKLFPSSLVNWIVTALILSTAISSSKREYAIQEVTWSPQGLVVCCMFTFTIAMTVLLHTFLHLPPAAGMMLGLGILKSYSVILDYKYIHWGKHSVTRTINDDSEVEHPKVPTFNSFAAIRRAEWDTLLFFYGVILAVGGLAALGYLSLASELLYGQLGASFTNILIGFGSAIFDNIPLVVAVLVMNPEMSLQQWLLITLTAGVGGSMLSIGSAAGVAVMGQARGIYTFVSHLKWSWAVLVGYLCSVGVHYLLFLS